MIIGIYIALPFVAVVFRNFSFRSFSLPLGVLLIVQFVLPFISNISVVFGFSPIAGNSALDISFFGGAYGLYIVFGYFVQSGAFDVRCKSEDCFSYRRSQLFPASCLVIYIFRLPTWVCALVFRFSAIDCILLFIFTAIQLFKTKSLPCD